MGKYTELYKQIHKKKKYGISGDRLVPELRKLIPTGCKSLLDYGAGQSNTAALLGKELSIPTLYAYDACVEGRNVKPEGRFDVVICTDVLEHIPEDELDELLQDIGEYSDKAIFVVSLVKAGEILPNGENAHCTVKPESWWIEKIKDVFPDIHKVESGAKRSSYVVLVSF